MSKDAGSVERVRYVPLGTIGSGGTPSFALRNGRRRDYAFAKRLYIETMEPLLTKLGAWDEQDLVARFRQAFDPDDVQIIEVDGVDAGYLQVSESAEEISLAQIHLAAPFRSRGIGTRLIRALMSDARTKGKPVSLAVVRNNPAFSLYRRLGFRVIGEDGPRLFMRWE
jgi:ribosomal protein S18 acetylase RimI-like enzyme